MTNDEINARIAELLGWKRRPDLDYSCTSMSGATYGQDVRRIMWARDGRCLCEEDLPRFATSLDCMALAEATLTEEQWIYYRSDLCRQIELHGYLGIDALQKALISSSAHQRALAFIEVHKTI